MTKTNVQSTPSNSQHHDTPNNKTHVIKFRVTAEEKASLELTCKLLNLSLSTFIRRALHSAKIERHCCRCRRRRRSPDRRFRPARPVQQGGRKFEPACTTLQLRWRRHRADPGETP